MRLHATSIIFFPDPADYSTSLDDNNLLTFTVGSAIDSQQCITVTVVDDTIPEPTESFFLSIVPFAGPIEIDSTRGLATVNIEDNDGKSLCYY